MKKSHRLSFRKKSKKRPKVVQAIIYVSGDSLRVIEDKAGVSTDEAQVTSEAMHSLAPKLDYCEISTPSTCCYRHYLWQCLGIGGCCVSIGMKVNMREV